jgi:mevalonate kinase
MSAASAPGKIILFGEHAVVYGRPALAVPVTQVQATAEVTGASGAGIHIDAPEVHLDAERLTLPPAQPLRAAIDGVLAALDVPSPPPLNIRIISSIPVASGLGSGAAVSVALIRALSTHLGGTLTGEQVSAMAYEVEKLHHGTPSGIDNTVVTYARPVYFVKNEPIETLHVGAPFTLVIGDTGIPAPTKESVGDVRKLWETDKPHWEKLFDAIGEIARRARRVIESGETASLGDLMDENHALLQELTVSSPELDRLVETARSAGADGAKLSGGGRGGNMIALVRPDRAEAIAKELRFAGAKRTLVTTVE